SDLTGAGGLCDSRHVPERFGMISFTPVHPLFQEKTWLSDSPESSSYMNVERIPEGDLLAGRALMRLKAGLAIAGVVRDESGQAVPGARVTQNFEFRRSERSILTDADGSFWFRKGRPGNLSLTVQAANLAPVVTSLVFNASI